MTNLFDAVRAAKAEAQSLIDLAAGEGRDMTDDERGTFEAAIERGTTASVALESQSKAREAVAALVEGDEPKAAPKAAKKSGTFGENFINSDVMAGIRAQYPNGIPGKTPVQTGSVRVGELSNTLLTSQPDQNHSLHVYDMPGVVALDLMSVITIVGDAPQTIKTFTAAFTNAADAVVEGAEKPEAALTWSSATLNQEVIAQHMPVTNQALSHNSMMRTYVDNFLVNGVKAKVQENVADTLAGWVGLGTQAFDTDVRTTLRRAITTAQIQGQMIGAGAPVIGISPTDAEDLDLEQLQNVVLSPGETPAQATNIWRAPLVVSAAFDDGFAYVGDLSQVVYYTSGGVNVSVGLVGTQFIENKQTILAETEGVTGVLGAPAIVKAALTTP